MKLYLMQHGEAMSKAENPERPLTDRGKDDVGRVATFLARSEREIKEIRHSGKRRAEETASIVAQHLQAQDSVIAVGGINPNDDVVPVAEALQGQTEPVMIVGHLPFLSRLASHLLTGDAERTLVQFQMGGVVCLTRQEENWTLEWMIVPDVVL